MNKKSYIVVGSRGPTTVASQVPTAQAGKVASLLSFKRGDAFSQIHLHGAFALQRNTPIGQDIP